MIPELMTKRRSIRAFKPEPVPDEILRILVDAARTAPSASNKQPWRFVLVRDRAVIDAAVEAVARQSQDLALALRPEFRENYQHYARHFAMFGGAPALVVPLYRVFAGLSAMLEDDDYENLEQLQFLEHHSAAMSVSLAVQNLLLMAEKLGLGACCMTGPLIAEPALREIFRVPAGWRIGAVIPVGYPDEQPENPGRKPLDSVIRWL